MAGRLAHGKAVVMLGKLGMRLFAVRGAMNEIGLCVHMHRLDNLTARNNRRARHHFMTAPTTIATAQTANPSISFHTRVPGATEKLGGVIDESAHLRRQQRARRISDAEQADWPHAGAQVHLKQQVDLSNHRLPPRQYGRTGYRVLQPAAAHLNPPLTAVLYPHVSVAPTDTQRCTHPSFPTQARYVCALKYPHGRTRRSTGQKPNRDTRLQALLFFFWRTS
jgi:hypothetical protein